MEIVTHRILTMQSKIGMGRYADETVERLLHIAPGAVRYAYYKMEPIDFTPEVKAAADIRVDIPKPGVSYEAYVLNSRMIREEMTDEERMKIAAHFRRRYKSENAAIKHSTALGRHMTKGYMQRANQGKQALKR